MYYLNSSWTTYKRILIKEYFSIKIENLSLRRIGSYIFRLLFSQLYYTYLEKFSSLTTTKSWNLKFNSTKDSRNLILGWCNVTNDTPTLKSALNIKLHLLLWVWWEQTKIWSIIASISVKTVDSSSKAALLSGLTRVTQTSILVLRPLVA